MKANKIEILLDIKGQGLVNYNGKKPHSRFVHDMIDNGKVTTNGSFAKENIYYQETIGDDGNKKIIKIAKKIISGNLIRKEILGDENCVNADKLCSNNNLRIAFLSQDNVIARGFTTLKDGVNLKRKGAFSVPDAEQTCGAITWLETRTSEGKKTENSLFFKEVCGNIEYSTKICVDVKQLQFISIDDNYDRMSLKETDVEGFVNHINKRYGDGNATFGNWGTTHLNIMGEQGIVLSSKVASNIIRETIKRILNVDIKRATSYAKTSSVSISIGYPNDSVDLLAKPTYININKIEDYDKLVENVEFGVDFLAIDAPTIEKIEKKPKEKNV